MKLQCPQCDITFTKEAGRAYVVVVMSAHGDRKLAFVAPSYFTTSEAAEGWITNHKSKDHVYVVQALTEAA